MRSKAICLALLALACSVQARPVSESEASRAAFAWTRTGMATGAAVGVEKVATLRTEANVGLYAAKLVRGGTVFLADDTERRPVIAFVASTNDFSSLDEASPLWALLQRDQRRLAEMRAASGATAAAAESVAASEREWAVLLAEADDGSGQAKAVEPVTTHVPTLSDVRAGPLVKSQWGQSLACGQPCYNYYTPVLSDGSHAVCGCVATAMSQLMRFHRYPTQAIDPVTRACTVQASTRDKASAQKSLTTQGGIYDWDVMPLKPATEVTETERKAIGKLTSDAGISAYMNYDTDKNGGSGAFMFNAARALTEVFGYANASFYSADEVTKNASVMRNAMLSNLDAGYPVLMGIAGDGGHAIIGDGYGYKDDKLYVHLNMGWSGSDDVWYNLPDIDTSSYHFTIFDDLVYNIFPKAAGGMATLSGRVVNDDGVGVVGAQVTIRASGDDAVVTTDKTRAGGIYGVRVAPGTYDIEVRSAGGTLKEVQTSIQVGATRVTKEDYSVWINKNKGWSTTYKDVPTVSSVGNHQERTEVILYKPTVRIGATEYASLDKALVDAQMLYELDPSAPIVVEVFDDTELNQTVTIDFECRLYSDDSAALTVTRKNGAKLPVAATGCLAIHDIAFDGADGVLVEVAAEGRLEVGGNVDFGVPEGVAAVRTQKSDGFLLAGEPLKWFAVDCASAQAVGDIFGYADAEFATASAWASKFVNLNDPDGELAGEAVDGGSAPYALRWALVPVPIEDAAAYYVLDGTVETNCFRKLDRLVEMFEKADAPGEITLMKDVTLSRRTTLSHDLRMTSSAGAAVICTASAGFTVGADLALAVDGVSFAGPASGDSLFAVEGGELTLTGTMAIADFNGTMARGAAAIRVSGGGLVRLGSATSDIEFVNCNNGFGQVSTGGAICASDTDSTVELLGGVSITGCHSRGTGGGIYLGKGAKLRMEGEIIVRDNTSGADSARLPSDVYCGSAQTTIEVTGLLKAGSAVGIRKVVSGWNQAGYRFAAPSSDFTDPGLIYDSAGAFFCDGSAGLKSEPSAAYDAFLWVEETGGVKPVDPSVAHVHVFTAGGSEIGYYGSLEDGLAALDGAAGTIELTRDTELVTNLTVTAEVAMKSAAGGPFKLTRALPSEIQVPTGGSLTISDLEMSGEGTLGRLFHVEGGTLVFASGATMTDVTGDEDRNAAAIRVVGGCFVMKDGARIANCMNQFDSEHSGNGRGGAVSGDEESLVRLEGGVIENCTSRIGAGIFIGNRSDIEIGGAVTVTDNADALGAVGNVYVPAYCELRLVAPLTGGIGVTQGLTADPIVFGRVAEEYVGSDAELADSAHRFTNDRNGDLGFAVRNGSETLLVWSDGLNVNGQYVDANGKIYVQVPGGTTVLTALPTAIDRIYNGEEQVGVTVGHGYELAGAAATHADSYAATVTLKVGFAWDDSAPEKVRTVDWQIAPAGLTVTANPQTKYVGEADPELTYAVSGLQGTDVAATTLTGRLTRAPGETVDTYAILQGTLSLTTTDYALTFVGSTLTILDKPVPPPPEPPATNYPTPIAFQSIVKTAAGQWTLVVTNGVKDCWYSLWGATELDLGEFKLIERRQVDADGPVTFEPTNVQPTDGQWFWQARGEPGEVRE